MNPKKTPRPAGPNKPLQASRPPVPMVVPQSSTEESEPSAGFAHAPLWLVVLFGALFYWGQMYMDNHAGGFDPQVYEPYKSVAQVKAANPASDESALVAKGEAQFIVCGACHGANGLGSPGVAPPLAGSEWVTAADPARLIRIPLHGLKGPITVNGQDYDFPQGMLPAGAQLADEDLAAVLSYMRQAWGNKASPVTPAQVAKVKEETTGRSMDGTAPWTAEELQKVPLAQ